MPDALSLSAGVSLGLLAGIVSGVFYFVSNGISWNSKKQKAALGPWLRLQASKALDAMPWALSTERLQQIDEEAECCEDATRALLEALAAQLAGGPLEATGVAPLYHHQAYTAMMERLRPALSASLQALAASLRDEPSHLPASPRRGPESAHARLARLVALVVREASALPPLGAHEAPPSPPAPAHSYEDLLATAILNKVIDRYQRGGRSGGSAGRSSGIHSASASPEPSEPRSPSRDTFDGRPPRREEREAEGVSDWEEGEATHDASQLTSPRTRRDLSLKDDNLLDYDEVTEIRDSHGSWAENWLFQKKTPRTLQSGPVPMLVPSCAADYRALIGDRDADDTTDLSDNASDVSEEELSYRGDFRRALDSQRAIGGKRPALHFEPDSLTVDGSGDFVKCDEREYERCKEEARSEGAGGGGAADPAPEGEDSVMVVGVGSGPLARAEFNLKEQIHRTHFEGDEFCEEQEQEKDKESLGDLPENKSSASTLSRSEREKDYEETLALPVQRYADSLRRKHFDEEPQQIPTRDTDRDDLIPGTIAYRERQKWLNSVEMPNNPYSPEAIQKRLSARSTSSLFDSLAGKSRGLDDEAAAAPAPAEAADSAPLESPLTNGSRPDTPTLFEGEITQHERFHAGRAKGAAEGREQADKSRSGFASSDLIERFNTIASDRKYTQFLGSEPPRESITILPDNTASIMIEYEDSAPAPAQAQAGDADADVDEAIDDILRAARHWEQDPSDGSFLSSSTLDDCIQVYNVRTGEILKSEPCEGPSSDKGDISDKGDKEAPLVSASPVCARAAREEEDGASDLALALALPRVRDLAQRFGGMQSARGGSQPPLQAARRSSREDLLSEKAAKRLSMHSLTARSVPKQFREELRLGRATPLRVPGGSRGIPEGAEEASKESPRARSPVPEPGALRTMLAFFEGLAPKASAARTPPLRP